MEDFAVETMQCMCQVRLDRKSHMLDLHIIMKAPVDNDTVSFLAAAPIDRHQSFPGSGLPFASPDMAIDGTPSHGVLKLQHGRSASIQIPIPNSYYAGLGSVLVPPTVYLVYKSNGIERVTNIKVDDPIPCRTLTYDYRRTGAHFYDTMSQLPVRSQEQVIRDSAYSTTPIPSFWGLKPPL